MAVTRAFRPADGAAPGEQAQGGAFTRRVEAMGQHVEDQGSRRVAGAPRERNSSDHSPLAASYTSHTRRAKTSEHTCALCRRFQDAAYNDFLNNGNFMGDGDFSGDDQASSSLAGMWADDDFMGDRASSTLPGVCAANLAPSVIELPLESNIRYAVPRATTASFESVHLPPPARVTGTSRTSRLLRLSKEHRFSTTPQNFSSRGSL